MTTAWEVISEWLAMANNANRHNLTMTLVDKPMLLAVVVAVTNRQQHSLQLNLAAVEQVEDSRRSKERVFK